MKRFLLLLAFVLTPLASEADVIIYEGSVTEVISGEGTTETTKRPAYLVREFAGGAFAFIERAPQGRPKTYIVTLRPELRLAIVESPKVKLASAVQAESNTENGIHSFRGFALEGPLTKVVIGSFLYTTAVAFRGSETFARVQDGQAELTERKLSFTVSKPLTRSYVNLSLADAVEQLESSLQQKGYTRVEGGATEP